jgi:hypothetical protein
MKQNETEINPNYFQSVISELMASGCKSVTQVITETLVVKATWKHKRDGRMTSETLVVTFGKPNYSTKHSIAKLTLKKTKPTFIYQKYLVKKK